MAYPYKWAVERFNEMLERPATPVYEITSEPVRTLASMKKYIDEVGPNVALWQHTQLYHTAMIYIQKNHGKQFNRKLLDLIHSGVDTEAKFQKEWVKRNKNLGEGVFPSLKSSYTTSARAQQKSYVVVDRHFKPNPNSRIEGTLPTGEVHRTHLISAQTTGIENHRGLLIDYDGWLNTTPLNEFEDQILEATNYQSLIWIAQVWATDSDQGRLTNMHYRYLIYRTDWTLFAKQEWVDDRWHYQWFVDDDQLSILKK